MDPSDTEGQLKGSAVPTDLGKGPSSGQQLRATIPQGIPANASHEYHGHALAANAGHGHAVAPDQPLTGMDDQSRRSATLREHGGIPPFAQQTGANIAQTMYSNASHGPAVAANASHGHAVAQQFPPHVQPAMVGGGNPLQAHLTPYPPTPPVGYVPFPQVGGGQMRPAQMELLRGTVGATGPYFGQGNLQQLRVPANLDSQQQLDMMQYMQLMQHQQRLGSVTFPPTPPMMGTSSGTPQRHEETTIVTEVRMPGQPNIPNNGVSTTADTVVSRSAGQAPRTHDHSVVGESQNPGPTLSDESSKRSVTSLSSLSQSDAPPEPN